MNNSDFIQLKGLLLKLETLTNQAAKEDGSFRKYNSSSISSLKAMRENLDVIEHGLRTANYLSLAMETSLDSSIDIFIDNTPRRAGA